MFRIRHGRVTSLASAMLHMILEYRAVCDFPADNQRLRWMFCFVPDVGIGLARFIHDGAEGGLWGDEITSNMMASG